MVSRSVYGLPVPNVNDSETHPTRMDLRRPWLLILAAFLLIDAVFLCWVWVHFSNWGIWDWDVYQTLLEAARTSVVDHKQIPLWNPFLGGGFTLVGHPAVRAFNPSFLVILALGTIPGIKVCILLYLLVAQWGAYRLARAEGLSNRGAFVAAIVFSLGGWYAQHLTHGHFSWIGFAWTPFVAVALQQATAALRLRHLIAGGFFCGLALLDGGPYVAGFTPVFLGLYAVLIAIRARTLRPLIACMAVLTLGAVVSAIQILPIAETILTYPRETIAVNEFYGAPFEVTWLNQLYQGLVSRQQTHDPDLWMPYVLSVGSYVGWIPLGLGVVAIVLRRARAWPAAVACGVSLWIYFGPAAGFDLWSLLHNVPILGSLQMPSRFNVFAVLTLGLLAGHGFDALSAKLAGHRLLLPVTTAIIGMVVVDLTVVNAPVFKFAFAVPPVPVKEAGEFYHHTRSPYESGWAESSAIYPIFPNWPSVTYASTLENQGVILGYYALGYPRSAIPRSAPWYRGSEVWVSPGSSDLQIRGSTLTPNLVTVDVLGTGGRIVVNQNYHKGWTLLDDSPGRVENSGGRLSVVVPAGEHHLRIAFKPRSFEIGFLLSALAVTAAAAGLWFDRPGRHPAARDSKPAAR